MKFELENDAYSETVILFKQAGLFYVGLNKLHVAQTVFS
jgi:hypothetical protein